MLILPVDNAPSGLFTELNGPDPWVVAEELAENNITLIIVGVEPHTNSCDDFYWALAQKTG